MNFTDATWSTPESNLSADDFCQVCLIDDNPAGKSKLKKNCHLPVRSSPSSPYNRAAIRNAAARLAQLKGVSAASIAAAKARLISLASKAGIATSLAKQFGGDPVSFSITVELLKSANDADRIAYGVVYPCYAPGEGDKEGDRMSAEEIAKAAHGFMEHSQGYDVNHRVFNIAKSDAQVVESYIAPVDMELPGANGVKHITKGSWVVATRFSPTFWGSVAKGDINAYSICGYGLRRPLESTA